MKIYADYTEEPDDKFLPLTEEYYRELYDLEMNSFQDDLPFYLAALNTSKKVLELGCGSGRLSRLLAARGYDVTGADLSSAMLKAARTRGGNVNYVRMDMRHLGFSTGFDAVIIPYNSLNLLPGPADIRQCLQGCRDVLAPGGKLLLHLYLPHEGEESLNDPRPSFQFQMFDRPEGGKIIKEMKRTYLKEPRQVVLTEQYKIRPMTPGAENLNYRHTMYLAGWSRSEWIETVTSAGFEIAETSSSYDGHDEQTGLLLVEAHSGIR